MKLALFGHMSEWGGNWTEIKLDILKRYLEAYLTAMTDQRQRYRLGYIDGFAGTGYRRVS